MRYPVWIDEHAPIIVNIRADQMHYDWSRRLSGNINITSQKEEVEEAGYRTLTYMQLNQAIAIQNFVISTGQIGESYLSTPESQTPGE